jgi:hypothetical protein
MTASADAQQTAETIARRIREESIRMRELVVAIRQSGAVEELVDSYYIMPINRAQSNEKSLKKDIYPYSKDEFS